MFKGDKKPQYDFFRRGRKAMDGMLKASAGNERDTSSVKFTAISGPVSPCFATRRLC
jgi:hypothetical protein